MGQTFPVDRDLACQRNLSSHERIVNFYGIFETRRDLAC